MLLLSPRSDRKCASGLNATRPPSSELSPDLKPRGAVVQLPMTSPAGWRGISRENSTARHRHAQRPSARRGLSMLQRADCRHLHGAVAHQQSPGPQRLSCRDRLRRELASYLATVENGAASGRSRRQRVGTSAAAKTHRHTPLQTRQMSLYSFCPARCEGAVALPLATAFVVANSGVVAEKTGGAMEAFNAISRGSLTAGDVEVHTGRRDACLSDVVRSSSGATRPACPGQGASPERPTAPPGSAGAIRPRKRGVDPRAFAALSAGDCPLRADRGASQSAAEHCLHTRRRRRRPVAGRPGMRSDRGKLLRRRFRRRAPGHGPPGRRQPFADRCSRLSPRRGKVFSDEAVGAFQPAQGRLRLGLDRGWRPAHHQRPRTVAFVGWARSRLRFRSPKRCFRDEFDEGGGMYLPPGNIWSTAPARLSHYRSTLLICFFPPAVRRRSGKSTTSSSLPAGPCPGGWPGCRWWPHLQQRHAQLRDQPGRTQGWPATGNGGPSS